MFIVHRSPPADYTLAFVWCVECQDEVSRVYGIRKEQLDVTGYVINIDKEFKLEVIKGGKS